MNTGLKSCGTRSKDITRRTTEPHSDGHGDYMTESAKWGGFSKNPEPITFWNSETPLDMKRHKSKRNSCCLHFFYYWAWFTKKKYYWYFLSRQLNWFLFTFFNKTFECNFLDLVDKLFYLVNIKFMDDYYGRFLALKWIT